MEKIEFDDKLFSNIKDILQLSYEYVDTSSLIEIICVYISLEWVNFYDVIYKIENKFYERHKVDVVLKNADISIENQRILVRSVNEVIGNIRELFIQNHREVPTQIKIIYSPVTGKNKVKFNYEKLHNDELLIGDNDLAEEWFEELQAGNGDIE